MNCYEFIRGLNKKGESRQGRYGKVSFGAGCRAFNPLSSLTFPICPFRGLAWRPCRVSNQPYSELFHTKHMWTMTSCAPIGSMDVAACTRQICLLPACWGHQHLGLCLPATYQTPGVSSHYHTPLHQFASCWGKQVGLWFFFPPEANTRASESGSEMISARLTFSFILSTLYLSWGTTLLGGKPFSNCVTNLAYLVTWLFRASGSKQSNLDYGKKKRGKNTG